MWLFGFILIIVVLLILAINFENKKKDQQEQINELKTKTELLRKENNYIAEVQSYYFEHVNNGKQYESNQNFIKAIEQYKQGIKFAENESSLSINFYANSIHRLIILYGKTKQYDDLNKLLENSISKYPNYRDVGDWVNRLEKLNSKLNKGSK